ncbi:undecaprenyl/decaprenyl-phosphate alpha-N-acetylglucosaminyl 1-phosphate transferase [Microaerobacter geothermalis]|uniref:MraY family glycosyltransferase n=1 Tax=Microaerobacter geothermalis TaxID=674972 RepID=UPI001F2BCFED|nr:MraY family glycosyltransferase [Microaerobacter geothermalis]MCF6093977.1 undecaprenyl/decaprenyl-phosphate alpha-N-acetylglucosaminyl 1-phosphate transferase [Microaerobacter geothermalis]
MLSYLLSFLFSFFIVYLLIPVTRTVALAWGLVDVPNSRKQHQHPIPLSGGLAIYLGLAISMMIWVPKTALSWVIWIGGGFLVLLGVLDDWFKSRGQEWGPVWKLLGQISVAIFSFMMGVGFWGMQTYTMMDVQYILFPQWVSLLATILWVVALTNMINFLDGLDGLAAGITSISALSLFFISVVKGQTISGLLSVILIGSSLAFLRHNFFPAQVFMGDAGSMLLGFLLAVISLDGAMKGATLFSLLITILVFGVPIFDTIQVFWSRLKAGRPIYFPDRSHVHHRLLGIGLSQKQTVLVLYTLGIGFSLLSIWLFWILIF